MAAAANAALVPCFAARRQSSLLSPILQQQQQQQQCGDRSRTHHHHQQQQQQQFIWGGISSSRRSGRCLCSGDESFTGQGNVVIFDEQAAQLEEFIASVKDKLVVLDISTKTCGPCKFIFPKIVKLSEDYPDAVFLKINGDHDSDTRALMRKWKIRAVPTFKFFRNGEVVHSHSGAKEDDLRGYFLVHYHSEKVSA